MKFKTNKIFLDLETVAEQLRSSRQERGLKIEEVARRLSINKKYLEALEKGNFNELPTGVYGKNFLREYSLFLGLDHKELDRIFQREFNIEKQSSQKDLFSRQVAHLRYFLATPRIIKNFIIAFVVISCFIYFGFAVENVTSPPALLIESPYENMVTSERTISIIGTTEAEAQILINGQHVLSDTEGNFSKKIDLKNGVNIITIIAKKKYGRENTIKRQILVKDK